jgi:hypothetical protein
MLGSVRVWIIVIGLIFLSTIVTGYTFYSSEGGISLDKNQIRDIMSKYNTVKLSVQETKSEMNTFQMKNETLSGTKIIKIFTSPTDGRTIREIFEGENLTARYYHENGDHNPIMSEYYIAGEEFPYRQEYDLNGDGDIEVLLIDKNENTIIEADELDILLNGNFFPFSSFSTIIM